MEIEYHFSRERYNRVLGLIHDYWGLDLYLSQPAENARYSLIQVLKGRKKCQSRK